jgi:hypothetical protein
MYPILETIKKTLPEGAVFDKPMSKKARILLVDMLNWVNESNLKFGGFKQCFTEIIKLYNPGDFEHWCHIYDMSKYMKKIPSSKKMKTKGDVIYWFEFMNLHDDNWVREAELSLNPNRVGNLQNCVEIYNWLTSNWLYTDFTEYDLNKIAQMGHDNIGLDLIKTEARQITDRDKHNIPYLYAVVDGKAKTAKAATAIENKELDGYRKKMQQLYVLAKESTIKLPMRGGTALADPARTRAYAEAIRNDSDDDGDV